MSDLIDRQTAIDLIDDLYVGETPLAVTYDEVNTAFKGVIRMLPSAQPELVRCCKCGFWDRDTLRHQFNDFREWNEAECKILAERDPYHEINRYTEADDFCSYAERRTDGSN